MTTPLTDAVAAELDAFMAESAARYRPVIASLSVAEDAGTPVVSGFVLAAKQLQSLRTRLRSLPGTVAIGVSVLAEDAREQRWVAPVAAESRVVVSPAQGAKLATVFTAEDASPQLVAVPIETPGFLCVRLADEVLGWVTATDVRTLNAPATGLATRTATRGSAVPAPDAQAADFIAEVERFLGVPYLLGGTTERGIDCSGLIQRAALRADGVQLPRHTTSQMKCGLRLSGDELLPGDVVYLQSTVGQAHMHAAVITAPGGTGDSATCTIHASRTDSVVRAETLGELLSRYTAVGYRRFIDFGQEG